MEIYRALIVISAQKVKIKKTYKKEEIWHFQIHIFTELPKAMFTYTVSLINRKIVREQNPPLKQETPKNFLW